MNQDDPNRLKSVQVPAVLVPLVKKMVFRYRSLTIAKHLSPFDAFRQLLLQWDNSSEFNSEIKFQKKLNQVKEVIQQYVQRKKATRDWTQAARLINELIQLLGND